MRNNQSQHYMAHNSVWEFILRCALLHGIPFRPSPTSNLSTILFTFDKWKPVPVIQWRVDWMREKCDGVRFALWNVENSLKLRFPSTEDRYKSNRNRVSANDSWDGDIVYFTFEQPNWCWICDAMCLCMNLILKCSPFLSLSHDLDCKIWLAFPLSFIQSVEPIDIVSDSPKCVERLHEARARATEREDKSRCNYCSILIYLSILSELQPASNSMVSLSLGFISRHTHTHSDGIGMKLDGDRQTYDGTWLLLHYYSNSDNVNIHIILIHCLAFLIDIGNGRTTDHRQNRNE